jgi:hypothetical protein
VDEGFQDLPLPRAAACRASASPVQPCSTGGLRLYRSGRFLRSRLRPYAESVLAYARGLSWLTVSRVEGWPEDALFGIGEFPETVRLPRSSSLGYYQPATTTDPRRLALHTNKGEFLLATNLPRSDLLAVGASLPVTGLVQPEAWRVQKWSGGQVVEGVARTGFELLAPSYLPAGYGRVAARSARSGPSVGVTLVYRRPAAELDGTGLVLYQASGQTLTPPDSPDQQVVMVGSAQGRWSPEKHLLEWIDHAGVYRSLSGPAFDLPTLLRVATSLEPEGSP